MVSREEVEGFLLQLDANGASHTEVDPGFWIVKPGGELDLDVVVHHTPPVLLLRVDVMTLPTNDETANTLARHLLDLNANDLVHGSYGTTGGTVVLTEALELSHLDYEEFRAAFESMTVALASHLRELAAYRDPGTTGSWRAVPSREAR